MQGKSRRQSWGLTWLRLLAVPALTQVARVGEEGQPQPCVVTNVAEVGWCGMLVLL